jgi:hypothetical protein
MEILWAFAPFITFAIIDRVAGPTPGLIAGAIVSAAFLLRDWLVQKRTPKVLEVGSALLFGSLAAYRLVAGAAWSVVGVRLRVDVGLLLVVLVSILIRRPFTLQYAREQASRDVWASPEFIRTNYIITAVWAAAFLVMIGADLFMLYVPTLPLKVGVGATILAILGAMRFTSWYPDHLQASEAQAAPQGS